MKNQVEADPRGVATNDSLSIHMLIIFIVEAAPINNFYVQTGNELCALCISTKLQDILASFRQLFCFSAHNFTVWVLAVFSTLASFQ